MTVTTRTVAVNGVKHYAIAWDRTLCGRGPVEEIGSYWRHAPAECRRCRQIAAAR